jgi:hypothetical protein
LHGYERQQGVHDHTDPLIDGGLGKEREGEVIGAAQIGEVGMKCYDAVLMLSVRRKWDCG